jgi:hypothetical protein
MSVETSLLTLAKQIRIDRMRGCNAFFFGYKPVGSGQPFLLDNSEPTQWPVELKWFRAQPDDSFKSPIPGT